MLKLFTEPMQNHVVYAVCVSESNLTPKDRKLQAFKTRPISVLVVSLMNNGVLFRWSVFFSLKFFTRINRIDKETEYKIP